MGNENPGTTNRMNNLALLYLGQERYTDAEPLLKKAFFINKRCLGAEHPETARTMENLAFLYLKQGRYRRAEPLLYRALCIHAHHSGGESPDIAYPLYGLAELYRVQKKYEQLSHSPLSARNLLLQSAPGSASYFGLTVPASIRPLLANHLPILPHFHLLLWLAEPLCFF
jgi:tetratricopeptide (TPR) repeat protein